MLDRRESVHTLQRAIHSGEIPHYRGRLPEEMLAISGSLALLTNLVIGWASLQIQTALTALKPNGTMFAPEVIRHISPIRYANINFRGTFQVPVLKYGGTARWQHSKERSGSERLKRRAKVARSERSRGDMGLCFFRFRKQIWGLRESADQHDSHQLF